MTSIPDVISPVPALLLNRTRGNVGWFQIMGDSELSWIVVQIVFWNEVKKTSCTVGKFTLN